MSEKRGDTQVTVFLAREEKVRLQEQAKKEHRTVSNLAGLLIREGLDRRQQAAAS